MVSVAQAERDAMESGKSLPASSAAEAALREHFSGEEGDKAVQQQVCSHLLSSADLFASC